MSSVQIVAWRGGRGASKIWHPADHAIDAISMNWYVVMGFDNLSVRVDVPRGLNDPRHFILRASCHSRLFNFEFGVNDKVRNQLVPWGREVWLGSMVETLIRNGIDEWSKEACFTCKCHVIHPLFHFLRSELLGWNQSAPWGLELRAWGLTTDGS